LSLYEAKQKLQYSPFFTYNKQFKFFYTFVTFV